MSQIEICKIEATPMTVSANRFSLTHQYILGIIIILPMKRKLASWPGNFQICLLGWGFCCLANFRADALETIIDFGNPTSYSVVSSYQEYGYSMSTYRMEVGYDFDRPPYQPLQGGLANVQGTLTVAKDDGGLFQCLSVDLRTVPYNSAGTYSGSLMVQGNIADGSTVSLPVVFTQGWTTFALPASFMDLSQLRISGGDFAVDNIVLVSVPEPSSSIFLALAAGCTVWRTRKKHPAVPYSPSR
jgi:hypothetical protein